MSRNRHLGMAWSCRKISLLIAEDAENSWKKKKRKSSVSMLSRRLQRSGEETISDSKRKPSKLNETNRKTDAKVKKENG